MLELTLLALGSLLQLGLPARPTLALPRIPVVTFAAPGPASYRPEDKSVSSWRDGTRRTLEPAPLAIAAAALDLGRPVVTRCVRLNNPWCIKRARWPGEIGADEEGHTAFASTEAGADAAATLLRSYYVAFGRKSALDIVRRWAPAECKVGIGGLSVALAVGGLAGTLRAQFLAANGGRRAGTATVTRTRRGVAVRAPAGGRVRVSVVPLARMPSYRVPGLVAGGGERDAPVARPRAAATPTPSRTAPVRSVAAPARRMVARTNAGSTPPAASPLPARRASLPTGPTPIPSFCGSEEGRIQAYAGAISRALGVQPGSDLQLFDAGGQPTVNLLPVMVAMSAVELGYLHAGPELAEGAIARLRTRLAEQAARDSAERDRNNLMDTGAQ